MKPELWGHQAKEIETHGSTAARGLLWSMRSGKTRVIVESVSKLYEEGKLGGVIVIAPNGVHVQWANDEFPRWYEAPINSLVWRSASTKPAAAEEFLSDCEYGELNILSINIDALRVERLQKLIRKFLIAHENGQQVMIVFDESHEFRRPGARKTRLARGLSKKCAYRRILTGTAALNSPLHVWSQFELLSPCALGHRTFGAFQAYYAEFQQQTRRDGRSYPQIVGYRNLDELQEWVSLWASVVPRSEADVPAVLRTKRLVTLSPRQRKAYDALKKDALLKVATEGGDEVEILSHMMKLQQVLGGFIHDVDGAVVNLDENPPRLTALVEEVLGSEPCRVIVWCRFREDIRRVRSALHRADVTTVEYHGGVSTKDREAALKIFEATPEPIAFVGQPQAAGQGLDLSSASTVIWYSHVHDAIVREQASARASVKGGEAVALVDLVAEKTLDLGILSLLEGKASLAEALTGEGLANLLAGLPPEELA